MVILSFFTTSLGHFAPPTPKFPDQTGCNKRPPNPPPPLHPPPPAPLFPKLVKPLSSIILKHGSHQQTLRRRRKETPHRLGKSSPPSKMGGGWERRGWGVGGIFPICHSEFVLTHPNIQVPHSHESLRLQPCTPPLLGVFFCFF